jgi:hypothetical protein
MPSWYKALEDILQPNWPLMVALGLLVILVTAYLIYLGHPVPLAAWLVYLASP